MSVRSGLRGVLPYAVAIAGGFLAAYLVVAFFIFPSGVIPREIRVPSVVGLQFDDAVRRLEAQRFRGVRGEERTHDAAPRGTVLEQHPAAGSRDVEGATIDLTVSIGQGAAQTPPAPPDTAPDTGGTGHS